MGKIEFLKNLFTYFSRKNIILVSRKIHEFCKIKKCLKKKKFFNFWYIQLKMYAFIVEILYLKKEYRSLEFFQKKVFILHDERDVF